MKYIVLLLLLCPILSWSQKSYETKKEASNAIRNGTYISSIGWMISTGEEVQFAQGSMPDKSFVYITEIPNIFTLESNVNYDFKKLSQRFSGRKAIIKDLMVLGNKKTGFYISAKIVVGEVARYMIDIENAIYAKEIKLPNQYASKLPTDLINTIASPSVSLADELKKLKELFDTGAITQEEYTAAKKKLIEH